MMKVLVTGGGGFIGRYVVEMLIGRGDQVRVLGRHTYPELQRLGVEIRQADLRYREPMEDACRDMDCVFHIGSMTGIWGRWEDFYQTNVMGTYHIISGCRKYGVPKIVYTSSPSVVYDQKDQINGDETAPYPVRYLCPYPETKALAEKMILEANGHLGLATIALRPHLVIGPGDTNLIPRLLDRARQRRLMIVGDGTNRVDLTYVENVAYAHLLAADELHPHSPAAGEAFFITQGKPVVLWTWINQLLERMGIPGIEKSISLAKAKKIGLVMETIYRLCRLRGEPPMTRFLASQLGTSHFFDISRAKKYLHYEPLVSLEEGLNRIVEYYSKGVRKMKGTML
ncbi:MAG: NAD-dependent epimerase/dehydratase family protein [bacterium]